MLTYTYSRYDYLARLDKLGREWTCSRLNRTGTVVVPVTNNGRA